MTNYRLVSFRKNFIGLLLSQRGVIHHMLAVIIVLGIVVILAGNFMKTKEYKNESAAPSQARGLQNNVSSEDIRRGAYRLIDLQADAAKAAVDAALTAWDTKVDADAKEKIMDSIMALIKNQKLVSSKLSGALEEKNDR